MPQISERMLIRKHRFHLERSIQECSECSIHRNEENIQSKSMGNGNCYDPDIFFIGLAPSQNRRPLKQDKHGNKIPLRTFEYLVGGRFRRLLKSLGLYERSYLTNLLKCSTPDNRKPKHTEIKNCSVWFHKEFNMLSPRAIVPLGNVARRALERTMQMTDDNRGFLFGVEVIVINCFHPNYCYSYGGITEERYAELLLKVEKELE